MKKLLGLLFFLLSLGLYSLSNSNLDLNIKLFVFLIAILILLVLIYFSVRQKTEYLSKLDKKLLYIFIGVSLIVFIVYRFVV